MMSKSVLVIEAEGQKEYKESVEPKAPGVPRLLALISSAIRTHPLSQRFAWTGWGPAYAAEAAVSIRFDPSPDIKRLVKTFIPDLPVSAHA